MPSALFDQPDTFCAATSVSAAAAAAAALSSPRTARRDRWDTFSFLNLRSSRRHNGTSSAGWICDRSDDGSVLSGVEAEPKVVARAPLPPSSVSAVDNSPSGSTNTSCVLFRPRRRMCTPSELELEDVLLNLFNSADTLDTGFLSTPPGDGAAVSTPLTPPTIFLRLRGDIHPVVGVCGSGWGWGWGWVWGCSSLSGVASVVDESTVGITTIPFLRLSIKGLVDGRGGSNVREGGVGSAGVVLLLSATKDGAALVALNLPGGAALPNNLSGLSSVVDDSKKGMTTL